jgi:RNA polymerase sigma factor for flagellar operon FliA
MVKRIAYHLMSRLPHTVQLDDLTQAGIMGLLEAAKNYDIAKGASFETYASIRIRGHMLDEVRRNDWVPRSVYRNARLISKTVNQLEHKLGREVKDHEIAHELNLSLTEYFELLKDAAGNQFYSFDDLGVTDNSIGRDHLGRSEPHKNVLDDDIKQQLMQIIKSLPKKESLVLSLYYSQDLNLKEIGQVLGVSESRVSQIHTSATLRIKTRLLAEA